MAIDSRNGGCNRNIGMFSGVQLHEPHRLKVYVPTLRLQLSIVASSFRPL